MHTYTITIFIIVVLIALFLPKGSDKGRENMKNIKKNTKDNTKNVVFLHIPKNAGTAFIKSFKPQYRSHNSSFPKTHEFNIAIIRHPTERLRSIFAHVWERTHKSHNATDLVMFPTLHSLAIAYYDTSNPFHESAYDLLHWNAEKFALSVYRKDQCNDRYCIHWAPQHHFVYGHKGKVDILLKYENLENDVQELKKLNLVDRDKEFKTLNKSDSDVKRNRAFMTPLCHKLAHDIYKKDYALWESAGLSSDPASESFVKFLSEEEFDEEFG